MERRKPTPKEREAARKRERYAMHKKMPSKDPKKQMRRQRTKDGRLLYDVYIQRLAAEGEYWEKGSPPNIVPFRNTLMARQPAPTR